MQVRVKIVKRKNRGALVFRWIDPLTGQACEKSTGTSRRRDAERKRAELERQIEAGSTGKELPWRVFCDRYERERLAELDKDTQAMWSTAKGHLEDLANPTLLTQLTSERMSRFSARLRDKVENPNTRGAYLRAIRAALNWGHEMGWLPAKVRVSIPKVPKQKRMKGRAITTEEFERMVAAVPKVFTVPAVHESWQRLLWGLWHSGLRLSEALDLSWTDRRRLTLTDISDRRPMFIVHGSQEKGAQDRYLPAAPDFVEWLRGLDTPRRGLILAPNGSRKKVARVTNMQYVSARISDIGEAAGVKVKETMENGKTRTKFASAHDLRRAFGARWSTKVMPAVLMQLMRHESIETTLLYYAGQDATRVADAAWDASGAGKGAILGDTAEAKEGKGVV